VQLQFLNIADQKKRLMKVIPDCMYIELDSNMETHSEKAVRIIAEYIQR